MKHDCAGCALFELEAEGDSCPHVNRPGGLALTRRLVGLCAPQPGALVLEAAAGAGATLTCLRDEFGLRVIGLDLSLAMLRRAHSARGDLPLLLAEAGRAPLAKGRLALVLAECSLSLIGIPADGERDVLAEFHRLLAPGGSLALSDIYLREGDGLGLLDGCCLAGAQREERIRARLTEAGFRLTVWEDCTPLFTSWAAGIVFRMGSRSAFFRALTGSEEAAERLYGNGPDRLRFGYYLLTAEKV